MRVRMWSFLLVLGILLSSCAALPPSEYGNIPGGEVRMETQFPVYRKDAEQIQVILYNDSEEVISFGSEWAVEVLQDETWHRLPFRENTVWTSLLYGIQPGGSSAFSVHVSVLETSLKEGRYRVVKEIGGTPVSAEFEVGESHVGADSPYGYVPLEKLPAGYTAEDAAADGAAVLQPDGTLAGEERLRTFFEEYFLGMDTQIRLGALTDEGELVLTDILAEKKLGAYRISCRRDSTRANGTPITESYYSTIRSTEDGLVLSSALLDGIEDSAPAAVYEWNAADWAGRKEVAERLRQAAQSPENSGLLSSLQYLRTGVYWSPDGMTQITLYRIGTEFGVSRLHPEGGESGSMESLDDSIPVTGIRRAVWCRGGDTVMLICDTSRGEDLTGYVFYSLPENKVVSYTVSQHGYTVTEDGEILIPE